MECTCINCGCQLRTFNEELETLFTILLEETVDDLDDDDEVDCVGELARRILENDYYGWCGECAAKAYIN